MNQDLAPTNGATARSGWLQQSVQQFFNTVNWDNQPPEIQLWLNAAPEAAQTSSLFLTVGQFFGALNWEGSHVAAPLKPIESAEVKNEFTLDDFSDLF
jgi:hypothetical protein